MGTYLDGTYIPPMPTVMARADGPARYYPGKLHTVIGESESMKSWLVQATAGEELKPGRIVVYVDLEDSPEAVIRRLRLLGVPAAAIAAGFRYCRPEEPLFACRGGGAPVLRPKQAPPIALVQHWEDQLAKARTEADAARARLAVDPSAVTAAEWADNEAALRHASVALEGARQVEQDAQVAASIARAEALATELVAERWAEQAAALPTLVATVERAVADLLAAADGYATRTRPGRAQPGGHHEVGAEGPVGAERRAVDGDRLGHRGDLRRQRADPLPWD